QFLSQRAAAERRPRSGSRTHRMCYNPVSTGEPSGGSTPVRTDEGRLGSPPLCPRPGPTAVAPAVNELTSTNGNHGAVCGRIADAWGWWADLNPLERRIDAGRRFPFARA